MKKTEANKSRATVPLTSYLHFHCFKCIVSYPRVVQEAEDVRFAAARATARSNNVAAVAPPPPAESGPGPRGAGGRRPPSPRSGVQVYAPESDPINLQKRPQLRLPQPADVEGAAADFAEAPPSLQVPYLTCCIYVLVGTLCRIHNSKTYKTFLSLPLKNEGNIWIYRYISFVLKSTPLLTWSVVKI